MDIRRALKSQYGAGLVMLRQAVAKCPDDVWLAGKHPRNTWRIAYHTIYFTHLYLHQDQASFVPWERHREKVPLLWGRPKIEEPYSREETLAYLDLVAERLDEMVDRLNLDSPESGFAYYPNMHKLDHQLVNLRHLQGHVGQLSDRLLAAGVEVDWLGRG